MKTEDIKDAHDFIKYYDDKHGENWTDDDGELAEAFEEYATLRSKGDEYDYAESGTPEWICTENIQEACGDACIVKADEIPSCCPFWTDKNMKDANWAALTPKQDKEADPEGDYPLKQAGKSVLNSMDMEVKELDRHYGQTEEGR